MNNPKQIAYLYLLAFNILEGSLGKDSHQYQVVDKLLKDNNEPDIETYFPDEDGCPTNASQPVQDYYNQMLDNEEQYRDIMVNNDPERFKAELFEQLDLLTTYTFQP